MPESQQLNKSGGNLISGFTLVEMAVSLTIIGVLSVMGMHLMKTAGSTSDQQNTKAKIKMAKTYLQLYALKNNRLPCPDTDGDGLEEAVCTVQTGWLPYTTIGISDMSQNKDSELTKIRYGVYRGGLPLDLTEYPNPKNIDELNNLSSQFNQKLREITLITNPNNGHPYVSLNKNGVEGCNSVAIYNPAFIVSLQVDKKTQRPTVNNNCFFTDQIYYPTEISAVASAELLGWLGAQK